jgi:hypothetical protein
MDFITGKHISRRTLLRGAGAALALPFLEAMVPAGLTAGSRRARTSPHRFLAYYTPNGQSMEFWTPTGEGRDFQLSRILEPLAPFKDRIIIPTGLDASWNFNHAGGPTCFLTGVTGLSRGEPGSVDNTDIIAETSIDQILARAWGSETQLGSLELSLDGPPNAGTCAILNCAYTHTVSWRSRTQPLPMENHPRTVFERLFGDSGSTNREPRERRLAQKESLLDSVNEKLRALQRELGSQDQSNMDQYVEAVRDVERRIEVAEQQLDVDLPAMEQPQGIPDALENHLELLLDMQILAFQADITRVSTMMIGREVNARPYPQIGVPEAWHPLSHHGNRPDLIEYVSQINRYHVELFTRHLTKLNETPDGDGSLLDSITGLYGSGISNSQRHAGENLPLVVVGGGNGKLRGGQHLRYGGGPTHANLLVTLMDKMDMPMENVGGSTGRLPLDTLGEM